MNYAKMLSANDSENRQSNSRGGYSLFPAQIVVALEKLCLRIESRPTLGETARLAMQVTLVSH
jgi:hypothetical protein